MDSSFIENTRVYLELQKNAVLERVRNVYIRRIQTAASSPVPKKVAAVACSMEESVALLASPISFNEGIRGLKQYARDPRLSISLSACFDSDFLELIRKLVGIPVFSRFGNPTGSTGSCGFRAKLRKVC